ncbi:protein argonaute 3 [Nicotiana attenuata]|uniref:Protein argonaute 3 n=1 Tax=Nicotiana attenuata TaxID=49451 RepID=A0A1J6IL81_NICAT|nr:protein argonaute 3 [Nicotiana attenuata]OIT33259.1 protein argonaute 3 [Nicotiana attenuata]
MGMDPKNATRNFEIKVSRDMIHVLVRVLPAPDLKLGGQSGVRVSNKCKWNFDKNFVVEGRSLKQWVLIDFTSQELRCRELVSELKEKSTWLGMTMNDPIRIYPADMNDLPSFSKVEKLLKDVVSGASL